MIAGYNKAKVIKRFIERATRDANKTKKWKEIKMKTAIVFLADGFEDA